MYMELYEIIDIGKRGIGRWRHEARYLAIYIYIGSQQKVGNDRPFKDRSSLASPTFWKMSRSRDKARIPKRIMKAPRVLMPRWRH